MKFQKPVFEWKQRLPEMEVKDDTLNATFYTFVLSEHLRVERQDMGPFSSAWRRVVI